jgi:CRP-like cAMP-binding protein
MASSDFADKLLQKLRARDTVSDEEEAVLRDLFTDFREVGAGRTFIRSGVLLDESILLIEGLACRFKDLSDGQRQIMELHVSGDFVDLHSFLLKRLEHNVGALTNVRLAAAPHDRLRRITEGYPHLARMLWFSTLLDSAIHRERILSVGRRSALGRIAHLLCELYMRLEIVGLASHHSFPLALTQADLGDATGLTAVHVNRMLKKLRDDGLVTYRGGEVAIQDWERLQRVAEFTPSYLFLERQER